MPFMTHYIKHEKYAATDFLLVRRVKVTERNEGHKNNYSIGKQDTVVQLL